MSIVESQTVELSLPLPQSLDTRIYLRLTTRAKAIMLYLTTATPDELATSTPMGSFIYALPDRFNANQPLATTLYSSESSLEFTTRIAKLLARKTQLPVYVSSSISMANAGMGGTVEEEMEAFKLIVQVTLQHLQKAGVGGTVTGVNGIIPV